MAYQLREDDGRFKRGRKHVDVPSPADRPSPTGTSEVPEDSKGILDITYEKFREVLPSSGSVFTEDLTLAPE